MLIFDENEQPIILDSVHGPTVTDHFWVLDLKMLDYTLTPLMFLEETTAPSVRVRIQGFEFYLPTSWTMLIYDPETSYVDTVGVDELAGKDFTAFTYGPNQKMAIASKVTVVDYEPSHVNIGPSLNKDQMLCHPVGPDMWIHVASSDVYNKYLKDVAIGNII